MASEPLAPKLILDSFHKSEENNPVGFEWEWIAFKLVDKEISDYKFKSDFMLDMVENTLNRWKYPVILENNSIRINWEVIKSNIE